MTFLVAALSATPAAHATGTLYISPATQGPLPTNSLVTYQVKVANMDPFNFWEVYVQTDPSFLDPQSITISGNVLAANFSAGVSELTRCIDGGIPGAAIGCTINDGGGIAHSAIFVTTPTTITGPINGLLFNITYKVTAPTGSGSTPLTILTIPGSDPLIFAGTPVDHATVGSVFTNQVAQPDFSMSVSPAVGSVVRGSSSQAVVTAKVVSGTPGVVMFAASGLPSGVIASFSTTGCTPTCASTLIFSASAIAPAVSVTVTITGTAGSLQKSATFGLTVQPLPTDFTIAAIPNSFVIVQGSPSQTSSITLTGSNGFTDTVNLVTGVSRPSDPTAVLSQASVVLSSNSASATSTLTVSTTLSTSLGFHILTVTATGATTSKIHSVFVFVAVVLPPPLPDFAISANPTALFMFPGNAQPSLIILKSIAGFAGTLTLTATSSFSGSTLSLSQSNVVLIAGGFWIVTLRVSTAPSTPAGNYAVTVIATSGLVSHSVTVSVTVFG